MILTRCTCVLHSAIKEVMDTHRCFIILKNRSEGSRCFRFQFPPPFPLFYSHIPLPVPMWTWAVDSLTSRFSGVSVKWIRFPFAVPIRTSRFGFLLHVSASRRIVPLPLPGIIGRYPFLPIPLFDCLRRTGFWVASSAIFQCYSHYKKRQKKITKYFQSQMQL